MLLFDSSVEEEEPSLFASEGLTTESKAWPCIAVKSSHAYSHKKKSCLKAAGRPTFQMQISTPDNQLKMVSIWFENQTSLTDWWWKRIVTKLPTCKIICLSDKTMNKKYIARENDQITNFE